MLFDTPEVERLMWAKMDNFIFQDQNRMVLIRPHKFPSPLPLCIMYFSFSAT